MARTGLPSDRGTQQDDGDGMTEPKLSPQCWVRLRWETPSRYYEAHLGQDLWGTWVLTRIWGGRHNARGQLCRELCQDEADGQRRLKALAVRRERRGYRLVAQIGPY